jgi:polysaccharide export outer membrane protein
MSLRLLFFLLAAAAIFSCVPNKKVLYLQHEKTDLYGPAPTDSILRSYQLTNFHYELQHEDVLSIQISSLTPKEYDFFSLGLPQSNVNVGGNMNMGAIHGYLINKEGNIEFPMVGEVQLAGLTIYEAEQQIQKIVEEFLEEPVVRVRLLNFRITVLGEIRGGGDVINTFNNRLSVIEGLALAGGLGEMADRQNIKIIRQQDDHAEVFYIDLLDEEFMTSSFFYLHPNDIVLVPPLRQKPFRNYFGENLGLIVSSLSLLILVLNLIELR